MHLSDAVHRASLLGDERLSSPYTTAPHQKPPDKLWAVFPLACNMPYGSGQDGSRGAEHTRHTTGRPEMAFHGGRGHSRVYGNCVFAELARGLDLSCIIPAVSLYFLVIKTSTFFFYLSLQREVNTYVDKLYDIYIYNLKTHCAVSVN